MARVLIGISSWADRGLVGSEYYPASVKTAAARLEYYSREFSLAEIDSSYHHFPMRRELDLWLNNVPEGFTFDVKAFSLFTQHPTPLTALPRSIREEFGPDIKAKGNIYWHHLPEKAAASLWAGFARSVESLRAADKFGAVMFQFPPWFHPAKENYSYIARVKEMLSPYQIAVEFRFDAWLNDEHRETTLRFLKDREIALVCVDEPQGFRSSIRPLATVTARLGVVRFHGRNAAAWEQKNTGPDEKFKYLYNKEELEEWLPRVRSMAAETEQLHVIFKNKHDDYPVKNALQFSRMLGSDTVNLTI